MENRTINRVEYVNSLKLSPLNPTFPHHSTGQFDELLDANTKGAAVNAGSAQSFAAGSRGNTGKQYLTPLFLRNYQQMPQPTEKRK